MKNRRVIQIAYTAQRFLCTLYVNYAKLTGVCITVTVLGTVLLSNATGAIGIIMDHLYNIGKCECNKVYSVIHYIRYCKHCNPPFTNLVYSYPKLSLKAFIAVVMHIPHMGREQELGYSVWVIDSHLCISIHCIVQKTNIIL